MKCPLFRLAQLLQPREITWNEIDCLKEECALYHDGLEDCGLFLIQEYLALITAQLVELNKVKGG